MSRNYFTKAADIALAKIHLPITTTVCSAISSKMSSSEDVKNKELLNC